MPTRTENLSTDIDYKNIPAHVAIIMDGNGRWAQKKGLPRTFGHRKGMEALERTVEAALDFNIKYLTLYAFSTENWKRPLEEVGMLMNLLIEFVDKKIAELDRQGVRVRHIGSREHVAPKVLEKIKLAEERTSHNDRLILNLAFNYGSRQEITMAVQKIAQKVQIGEISLLWQIAYSEIYITDIFWPDFTKDDFLEALLAYQKRDRRYGGLDK